MRIKLAALFVLVGFAACFNPEEDLRVCRESGKCFAVDAGSGGGGAGADGGGTVTDAGEQPTDAGERCPGAGASRPCYDGPSGTEGVGICLGGTQYCSIELTWGPCSLQRLPEPESCANTADDDCDGVANESDAGCVCTPNQVLNCYSGPAGTLDAGLCRGGTRTCAADGGSLGACTGEVTPAAEACFTPADEDCNGSTYCSGEPEALSGLDVTFSNGLPGQMIPKAIVTHPTGGGFVIAEASGSFTFGGATFTANGRDVVVIRFDSNGAPQWLKLYGGAGDNYPTGGAVLSDGSLLVTGVFGTGTSPGTFEPSGAGTQITSVLEDGFVLQLDGATGSWLQLLVLKDRGGTGSGNQQVLGVSLNSAGTHAYLATTYQNSAEFLGTSAPDTSPSTDTNGLIIRFDPGANTVSALRTLATPSAEILTGIVTLANSDVVVAGSLQALAGDTFSSSNGTGGGTVTTPVLGAGDAFRARFNSSLSTVTLNVDGNNPEEQKGGPLSAVPGTSELNQLFSSKATTLAAEDACPALMVSQASWILVRRSAAGSCLWRKLLSQPEVRSVSGEHPVVVGAFSGTFSIEGTSFGGAGTTGAFVALFGSTGTFRGAQPFSGMTPGPSLSSVSAGAGGGWAVGSSNGAFSYGNTSLTGGSGTFPFLLRLAP